MNIFDIINVPIGLILRGCYYLTNNYGVAILLFAFVTRLCLIPLGIKSEKGRKKMNKAQPRIQQLQAKYKNNTRDPKYQEEMQKIYTEEGYSPTSGCLPQLIQLPIILSLWTNIRNPLTYLCDLPQSTIAKLFEFFGGAAQFGEKITAQTVPQLTLINMINEGNNLATLKAQGILPEGFQPLNIDFMGLNLGETPQFVWPWISLTVLLPILAALSSFLVSFISQKINQQDSQTKQPAGMNAMLYIFPLITLWMGFTFQNGICVYWIFSNVLMLLQTVLLAKFMKEKVPEAKVKEKKLNYNQIQKMEREQKEKEKENK